MGAWAKEVRATCAVAVSLDTTGLLVARTAARLAAVCAVAVLLALIAAVELFTVVYTSKPHPRISSPATTTIRDRKSTRLNSSHQIISYAVFCLKKKKEK